MNTGNPPNESKLSQTKALEARVEALEFLVLGLLRAHRENAVCKQSVIDTFQLMNLLLAQPEMRKRSAYQLECKMHYADAVVLTWCEKPDPHLSEFDSVTSRLQ